jgi:Tol biopolymer transport system component
LTYLFSLDVSFKWLVDGSEIVFMSTRGPMGRTQLCFMQEDGSQQRCVTDARYQTADPTWLDDQDMVLFASWQDSRYSNVFSLQYRTMEMTRIAPAKGYQSQPLPQPVVLPKSTPDAELFVARAEGVRRNP